MHDPFYTALKPKWQVLGYFISKNKMFWIFIGFYLITWKILLYHGMTNNTSQWIY